MSVALQIILAAGLNAPVSVDTPVPSGQPVHLFEVLADDVGQETWMRFRFIAPQIARDKELVTFFDVEPDFHHLCTHVALPYLDELQLSAEVVVVTLLDQPAEFGQADASVTQFIDAFRVQSGTCIWEEL